MADARLQAVIVAQLARVPHHGRLQSFGGVKQPDQEYHQLHVYPQFAEPYDQD